MGRSRPRPRAAIDTELPGARTRTPARTTGAPPAAATRTRARSDGAGRAQARSLALEPEERVRLALACARGKQAYAVEVGREQRVASDHPHDIGHARHAVASGVHAEHAIPQQLPVAT